MHAAAGLRLLKWLSDLVFLGKYNALHILVFHISS